MKSAGFENSNKYIYSNNTSGINSISFEIVGVSCNTALMLYARLNINELKSILYR